MSKFIYVAGARVVFAKISDDCGGICITATGALYCAFSTDSLHCLRLPWHGFYKMKSSCLPMIIIDLRNSHATPENMTTIPGKFCLSSLSEMDIRVENRSVADYVAQLL